MADLLGWMIRNPYQSAILSGIVIALLLGYVSLPGEKYVERRVEGWLPAGTAQTGPSRDSVVAAFTAYQNGAKADTIEVSEQEFRSLALSAALAFPEVVDGQREVIVRYAGQTISEPKTLYIAEHRISATGRWNPSRWAYKAVAAEVNQAGNVLNLTFQRDISGLFALLLLDVIVGAVYGVVIGLILGVLGLEGIDGKNRPTLPHPTPLPDFKKRNTFRA